MILPALIFKYQFLIITIFERSKIKTYLQLLYFGFIFQYEFNFEPSQSTQAKFIYKQRFMK